MLRKIECFLMPSKLEALKKALLNKGIEGMSILQAQGFGTRSKQKNGLPRFEERVKVEVVVDEAVVEEIISLIKELVGKGSIGAGIIFVVPVEDAVRLSTREAGKSAIL